MWKPQPYHSMMTTIHDVDSVNDREITFAMTCMGNFVPNGVQPSRSRYACRALANKKKIDVLHRTCKD